MKFGPCQNTFMAVVFAVTLLGMTWLCTNPSSSVRIKSNSVEIELKSNETVRLENQRKLPK